MKMKIHQELGTIRRIVRNIRYQKKPVKIPTDIVSNHFSYWAIRDHPNRKAFEVLFNNMNGAKKAIIETGTSAWGTDSTRLWDSYVRKFGGSFKTVDIRVEASERLKWQLGKRSTCYISDSVEFLKSEIARGADVYFLDSWDVDWQNPMAAAVHGLQEFNAIRSDLKEGVILFIDDTPKSVDRIPDEAHGTAKKFEIENGVLPGKGALVLRELQADSNYEVIHHDYAFIAKF
jgi:hypothetical protein